MYGKTYRERKLARTEHFNRYIVGWKLRKCTACSGSGYYDSNGSPSCGSCNGSGKERYKPEQLSINRMIAGLP